MKNIPNLSLKLLYEENSKYLNWFWIF